MLKWTEVRETDIDKMMGMCCHIDKYRAVWEHITQTPGEPWSFPKGDDWDESCKVIWI